MASSDRLRARDAANAEHSLVILERSLKTLGFYAVFSIKQLESNVYGDSTPQAPTKWIMHAQVRQTPGLLPGECGYDATSWARYADKVGVKMEDRKRTWADVTEIGNEREAPRTPKRRFHLQTETVDCKPCGRSKKLWRPSRDTAAEDIRNG
jgi:hypothetical protein